MKNFDELLKNTHEKSRETAATICPEHFTAK
jgi:hypothetical protein